MGHQIDMSKGSAAFISVAAPAWHKLGRTYAEGTVVTAENALKDGGLDFPVEKLPNLHFMPDSNSEDGVKQVISRSSFFTYRKDTLQVLGDKLGADYHVLQNVEALNLVDEILQAGTASIDTAGALYGGRKVFIGLKVNKDIIVGVGDTIKQYILIVLSHDGTIAITVLPTNVRVVCANTLAAALHDKSGIIKIKHTKLAGERLAEAAKVLNLITSNTSINTDIYNQMKEVAISKEDMMNYFGNIFLDEKQIAALQGGMPFDNLSTQKQNQLLEVASYAANGDGQNLALNGKDGLNMWYAYNAVTGYATRKRYRTLDDRANSMLFGSTAQLIKDAGTLALAPSKIRPLHKITDSGLNLN